MNLDENVLNKFFNITGFDINDYYKSFTDFIQLDYNYLVDYYSGKTEVINSRSFNNLSVLLKKNSDLFSSFTQNKYRLNNLMFCDLMIQIEEIDSSLMTIKNISKWLRSPITNKGFASKTEINVTLKQNQTLELLNKDVLREEDYQNSWVQTARRNNLAEEDYTSDGGNLLAVSFARSGRLFVQAVVDNLNGMNILGKDIQQKLEFANNDLKVLGYIETYKQSVSILSDLKTNDNPFLANDGVLQKDIIGVNRNLVNLPLIFRRMSAVFSSDDTISSFSITEVKRNQDALFAVFEVKSILGNVDEFKINLSN
jgi:hypothetical protein